MGDYLIPCQPPPHHLGLYIQLPRGGDVLGRSLLGPCLGHLDAQQKYHTRGMSSDDDGDNATDNDIDNDTMMIIITCTYFPTRPNARPARTM